MKEILDNASDSLEVTRRHLLESIRIPGTAVALIWAVHLHQSLFSWDPGDYGIMPRRIWSLSGILTAPLVHGSWTHLLSNTLPLFVLSMITFYFFRKVASRAFWLIFLTTGASVWLFARSGVSHIGASGIVYGLVSFIFWNGIFRRSLRSIILSLIVVLLYSGMFMGVLPDQEGISWESHLLGSIAGIVASFWFKGELEDDEFTPEDPFALERNLEKQFFLPRDAFEKTRTERAAEAVADPLTPMPPFWIQDSTRTD
jgi:membrane associated rhomboid family serine protease